MTATVLGSAGVRDHLSAALVVIGNEILSGKVVDTNTPFLAKELRRLGVSLERVVVIPDDLVLIAAEVSDFSRRFDVVFTSGGVGPTHDDITMDGVAAAFGRPLVEHRELRSAIENFVGKRVNAAHLKMAQVPEGAELIVDDKLAFPTVLVGNVYILPGIPELFQAKVVSLRDRFRTSPYFLRQVLVRDNETLIAEFLNATLVAFPELLLGSYPKLSDPEYRVRLTLESKDESYVDRALADLVGRLPAGCVFRVES
ncbi:MAG: competence/damage-inducible protein A [Candidatus Binatia bacterium]